MADPYREPPAAHPYRSAPRRIEIRPPWTLSRLQEVGLVLGVAALLAATLACLEKAAGQLFIVAAAFAVPVGGLLLSKLSEDRQRRADVARSRAEAERDRVAAERLP